MRKHFRLSNSLAVRYDFDIDQMVTVFLQSEPTEEIIMKFPEGYVNDENKFCKLKKSLYDLTQSSRVWDLKLDKAIKEMGFQQSKADPCIYFNMTICI